jgi:hypothetical protein
MSMQQKLADAMTTRYSAGITLWAQQKKAVTEGLCLEDAETGVENISEDFFGLTAMRAKNSRNSDLTPDELSTMRRWVFSQPYYNRIVVDSADKLRTRVDPATGIAEAQTAAAMRTKDQIFISASIGTAYAGKTFSTPVVLPAGGTIADGNVGYVITKFEDAVSYLKKYGQMEPGDRIWCLWTQFEEKTFGNQIQVGSRDYTTIQYRDKGEISSYGLVDFRRLEDVYDETGTLLERMLPYGVGTGTGGANTRTALMGVKKAIKRWTPKAPSGYVWHYGRADEFDIVTTMDCGAARRIDRGVVAVTCITTDA